MSRIFNRKKLFSTILNITGMTIALASFMVISIQVLYDWTYDSNFRDSKKIYRVEIAETEQLKEYGPYICRPLIESFKESDPDISALGTYRYGAGFKDVFRTAPDEKDGIPFTVETAIADRDFLDVFPFTFSEGSADGFKTDFDCIISRSTAEKMFGKENPVGKNIYNQSSGYAITIAAVYEDFPENCSIPNGIILQCGKDNLENMSEWSSMCYLKVENPENLERIRQTVTQKIAGFFRQGAQFETEEDKEYLNNMVRLSNLKDIYHSKDSSDSLPKGNAYTANSLFAISLLIIAIAIINFINFSMASVPFDIKSINTRKVLGSSRAALIRRQMAGSLAIVMTAYILGILAMHLISGSPLASYISSSVRPADNPGILAAGFAVSVVTAIIASLYPALYSTSFQPALVLKGSFSLSAKGRILRNALTGFQYVISFILAAMALFIYVQTEYMKKHDMGFRSEQVLVAYIGHEIGTKAEEFKDRLLANPRISDVTFAGGNIVSTTKMGWGRDFNGKRVQLDVLPVSVNFMKFFSMEILQGRGFTQSDNLATNGTFIMNEKAMSEYPFLYLGAKMTGHMDDEHPAEIVGIAKNFNFKPMQYPVSPLALYCFGSTPWWPLTVSYIRIAPDEMGESMEYIRNTMKEFDPQIRPENLELSFLDESLGFFYRKEERLNRLITVAAALSFIIALIGIIGLVYFETQFRRKEIALKKVYGASVRDILSMINRRYALLTLISFAISVPLSVAAMKLWVGTFPYQSPVPVWIFVLSLAAAMAITAAIVTLRSYNAATANPATAVKTE